MRKKKGGEGSRRFSMNRVLVGSLVFHVKPDSPVSRETAFHVQLHASYNELPEACKGVRTMGKSNAPRRYSRYADLLVALEVAEGEAEEASKEAAAAEEEVRRLKTEVLTWLDGCDDDLQSTGSPSRESSQTPTTPLEKSTEQHSPSRSSAIPPRDSAESTQLSFPSRSTTRRNRGF